MDTRRTPFRIGLTLACFLLCAAGQARADAVQQHKLSSTGWVVLSKGPKEFGTGTCWVVDAGRRLVMTNYHVVKDAQKLWVYFPLYNQGQVLTNSGDYLRHKTQIAGHVVASDPKRDLALIQLTHLPAGTKHLPLAAQAPTPGQAVHSVGNSGVTKKPLDQGVLWTCRSGKAATVAFRVWHSSNTGLTHEAKVVETDFAVQPGDSGGPLVNAQGQIVGVVSGFKEGKSLCIEVDEVRHFLNHYLSGNSSHHPLNPVQGVWTVRLYKDGQEKHFSLTLLPDGKLRWESEQSFTGTYHYNAGKLHLAVPALNINETVAVHWENLDHFQFTSAGIAFSCRRR